MCDRGCRWAKTETNLRLPFSVPLVSNRRCKKNYCVPFSVHLVSIFWSSAGFQPDTIDSIESAETRASAGFTRDSQSHEQLSRNRRNVIRLTGPAVTVIFILGPSLRSGFRPAAQTPREAPQLRSGFRLRAPAALTPYKDGTAAKWRNALRLVKQSTSEPHSHATLFRRGFRVWLCRRDSARVSRSRRLSCFMVARRSSLLF